MSAGYWCIKKIASALNPQKIMAQPYDELLKTFKTESAQPAVPRLKAPDLDCSVFHVTDFPVLYVKHKSPVHRVCVYVSGGGMLQYPRKPLAKKMLSYARKLNRDMVLPYYPLCPAYNLYDVYDMLYELYKQLLTEYPADEIALLGESSGGNHILGLISHIHANGEPLPLPGKIYAASPGTMFCTGEEFQRAETLEKTDFAMSRKAMDTIFGGMTGGREVPEYMRYLQKGDYTGLKDVYLCFGGDELLSAAAPALKARLEECGVKVTLEIGEGMCHCYSLVPIVPETRRGYENMIRYLRA